MSRYAGRRTYYHAAIMIPNLLQTNQIVSTWGLLTSGLIRSAGCISVYVYIGASFVPPLPPPPSLFLLPSYTNMQSSPHHSNFASFEPQNQLLLQSSLLTYLAWPSSAMYFPFSSSMSLFSCSWVVLTNARVLDREVWVCLASSRSEESCGRFGGN